MTGLQKTKQTVKTAPHYLGGSNNLVSERKRREHAENQVKEKKLQLQQLLINVVPKVEEISHAFEVPSLFRICLLRVCDFVDCMTEILNRH